MSEASTPESYQLFKTDICGFCYRVRAFLDANGIEIPLRDVNQDPAAFRELLQKLGSLQRRVRSKHTDEFCDFKLHKSSLELKEKHH